MDKKKLYRLKKNILISSLVFNTLVASVGTNKNVCYASDNNTQINTESEDNRPKTIDDTIKYYCNVFELDYDLVHDKLYDMTNNFEDYGWKYAYSINGKVYNNMEFAILSTIRDIYYNPENFGFDESIRTNNEYETDMEIEEMIYKYSSLYEINKEVALSIVYCECGPSVNSSNYLNNNNPAGIGPYMKFLNKEVGVIYFCNMLKYNYHCKKDSGESFLNSIASTYCEIPGHWLDLTLPYYRGLNKDYLGYVNPEDKDLYNVDDYEPEKLTLK